MTEKYERFQCTVTNGEVYNGRIFDQLRRMETTEVVDKLNEFTYENEKLKSVVEEMINIFQDSGLDYMLSEEVEVILNE